MAAIVTLNDLVTPATYQDTLTLELNIAAQLGLPTTAWQPIDPIRTILTTNAQIIAQYTQTINLIAQGGYASYAAVIPGTDSNVDSAGYETTWMDLVAYEVYNVQRIEANFATGLVTLSNATANTFGSPYSPGTLHFNNTVTGATYSNTGTVDIDNSNFPSASLTTLEIVADAAFPGALGNSVQGTVLNMVTPLVGVTVQALAGNIIATNQETNAQLLARCQAKLGSLSPNGASQAYQYVTTSLPVYNSQVTLPDGTSINYIQPTTVFPLGPYGVFSAITRSLTVLNIGAGIINVYLATSAGAVIDGCVQNPITNVTWSTGVAIVTCMNPVNLGAGDWVQISGVQGASGINTALSGTIGGTGSQLAWQVISAGSHSFHIGVTNNPGSYTSGGQVEGGDLGFADAAIQALVVPDGQVALVSSAVNSPIGISATVYIRTSAGISGVEAIANIEAAFYDTDNGIGYFPSMPIGGVTAESPNIVPYGEVLAVIAQANAPGTVNVANLLINGVAGDFTLAPNAVPTLNLGSFNITVILTNG